MCCFVESPLPLSSHCLLFLSSTGTGPTRRGAGSRATTSPLPIRLGLGVSGLMGFGGLLLYFFWPPALDWTLLPIPTEIRWAGATVAIVSVLSTWWVFRTLGLNVTRTSKTRDNATLVTTGPYRFVRHPFYVNVALAFGALSLVTRSWWFIAWIVPALILWPSGREGKKPTSKRASARHGAPMPRAPDVSFRASRGK